MPPPPAVSRIAPARPSPVGTNGRQPMSTQAVLQSPSRRRPGDSRSHQAAGFHLHIVYDKDGRVVNVQGQQY